MLEIQSEEGEWDEDGNPLPVEGMESTPRTKAGCRETILLFIICGMVAFPVTMLIDERQRTHLLITVLLFNLGLFMIKIARSRPGQE